MSSLFGDPRLPGEFWSQVTPESNSGCWLWTGGLNSGYGRISISGRRVKTHVLAYETFVNKVRIPRSCVVHHVCGTRSCCNPAHLKMETRGEHTRHHVRDPERLIRLTDWGKIQGRARVGNGVIHKAKPCIASDTMIFPSAREAARWLGLDGANIAKCCYGSSDYTVGGFTWKWV